MAAEEADPSPDLTPEMVAAQFVTGYYGALCSYPDVLYRFYEDSSTISWPNLDGVMSSASTMQGINEKILSLEYLSCKVEISSIDAQQSCNNGVIVLVTGFLIGEGEKKRSFTQAFFLAKNAMGYFVLNDIFRFGIGVDEVVATKVSDDVAENEIATPLIEENHESAQIADQQAEVKLYESVPEKINSNGPTISSYTTVPVYENHESAQIPDQQAEVKLKESVPEKINSNGPTISSYTTGPVYENHESAQIPDQQAEVKLYESVPEKINSNGPTISSYTTVPGYENHESAQIADPQAEVKLNESVPKKINSNGPTISSYTTSPIYENHESAQIPVQQAEVKLYESLPEKINESAQIPDQQAEVKLYESVPEKINSDCPTTSSYTNGPMYEKAPTLEQVVASEQPSTPRENMSVPSTPSEKQTQEPPKMSYASILVKKSAVSSTVKRLANPVVAVAPSANSSFDKKTPDFPEKNTPALRQAPSSRNNAPPSTNSSLDKKTQSSLEKKMPASQQAPASRRNNAPLTSDNSSDGKGIYIGNLPPHIHTEELDKAFSKYGPIKEDGIRVKTYADGFCYGFVEFESSDAARKAIEAHIFWFQNYKSYVTEKRSSGQVGNGNVRPSSRNGEFRKDTIRRSRENSAEGRGDGRSHQNGNRGDFGPNRGPINSNRNDSSFQNRASNGVGEHKWERKPAPRTSVE